MTLRQKGFTLVELLIVITILVILGLFVVLLINPAEILSKARDSQRISDLATLKSAAQLYLTDGIVSMTNCATAIPIPETDILARSKVYASLDAAPNAVDTNKYTVITTTANRRKSDGNGWVPLNFGSITSGNPLEVLPVDPSADLSAATDLTAGKYYRFGCYNNSGKFEYEFDAGLESGTWGPASAGTNNKGANDGGNANATTSADGGNNRYEVGNNLGILNTTASLTP